VSLCRRRRRQTSTRICPPSFKQGNQHGYYPTNHSMDAQHRHAQSRTMTQVTASIPNLRSSIRPTPRKTNAASQWLPPVVLVALTGLWMNFFYSRPPGDGESLVVVRLVVGSAMLASIVLAVLAIRRRDFISHGAWMTRGYAIALGAGTQVFTMLPWVVVFGPIGAADELPRTVLMTAGWVINLAVAEYAIPQRPGHRSNRTPTGPGRSRTV